MTLIEAKENLLKVKYDDTAWDELDFYNKELQRHHFGSLKDKLGEGNPMVSTFIESTELSDKMDVVKKTEENFSIMKTQVLVYMDDVINYLKQNDLPDISLADILKP